MSHTTMLSHIFAWVMLSTYDQVRNRRSAGILCEEAQYALSRIPEERWLEALPLVHIVGNYDADLAAFRIAFAYLGTLLEDKSV